MTGEYRMQVGIRTIQRQADGAVNRTRQSVCGLLRPSEGGWSLRYREDSQGLEGCQVEILLGEAGARISRSGPVPLELELSPGRQSVAPYRLCGMEYRLLVRAGQIMWRLNEQGGSILLCYQLELEGGPGSKHRMEFSLSPMKE